MNRLPNKNLTVFNSDKYQSLPVYRGRGCLAEEYLEQIHGTLIKALSHHKRTMALRVDLRLPPGINIPSNVISKFIDSLKAKIKADGDRKRREGKRVHPCQLRYVWCKEQAKASQPHYHFILLLNKDRFCRLGVYDLDNNDLFKMLVSAWASALNLAGDETLKLVYFPDNAIYWLDSNSDGFNQQFKKLFYRVSYFAKLDTKNYGDGSHAFGCSRI